MPYPVQVTYVENEVLNASPERLVQMLYEMGLKSIIAARECNRKRDILGRGEHVNKAFEILAELQSGLDFAQGGELATNYARLYDYCQRRLIDAHARQSDETLAEIESLFKDFNEAWQVVMASSANAQRSAEAPQQTPEHAGTFDCVG